MPKGYKNAIPQTDAEIAAEQAVDSAPGANAPVPAEAVEPPVDEAGHPTTPISDGSGELSPSAASDSAPELSEDVQAVDEPQAGFEIVEDIPARSRKLKYQDVAEFLRANPGTKVKINLIGKTSPAGSVQSIRRNFPDLKATVAVDPKTGQEAAYAVFTPAAQAPAETPAAV